MQLGLNLTRCLTAETQGSYFTFPPHSFLPLIDVRLSLRFSFLAHPSNKPKRPLFSVNVLVSVRTLLPVERLMLRV